MKNKILKSILIAALIVLSGFIIFFRIWFKSEINQCAEKASAYHNGSKVENMLVMLQAENVSLKDKNDLIWALGKSRDTTAVPVLNSLLTGKECKHATEVCQETLTTAIETLHKERIDLFTFNLKN